MYLTLVENTCSRIPLLQNYAEFSLCVRPRSGGCRGGAPSSSTLGLMAGARQTLHTLLQITAG